MGRQAARTARLRCDLGAGEAAPSCCFLPTLRLPFAYHPCYFHILSFAFVCFRLPFACHLFTFVHPHHQEVTMHFYWTFPDCERPVRVLDIKLSRVFPGQMLKDVAEVLRR